MTRQHSVYFPIIGQLLIKTMVHLLLHIDESPIQCNHDRFSAIDFALRYGVKIDANYAGHPSKQ